MPGCYGNITNINYLLTVLSQRTKGLSETAAGGWGSTWMTFAATKVT